MPASRPCWPDGPWPSPGPSGLVGRRAHAARGRAGADSRCPIEPPAAARELIGLLRRRRCRGRGRARADPGRDPRPRGRPGRGRRRRGARVEVGVGRHDREAFAMVHGDLPTAEALASVVRQRRSPTGVPDGRDAPAAPPRPRGLAALAAHPGAVRRRARRARRGRADPAAREREGHRRRHRDRRRRRRRDRWSWPARSASTSTSCPPRPTPAPPSTPSARLLLVVPERDDHPVTRRLAAEPWHGRPRSWPSPATGVASTGSADPR